MNCRKKSVTYLLIYLLLAAFLAAIPFLQFSPSFPMMGSEHEIRFFRCDAPAQETDMAGGHASNIHILLIGQDAQNGESSSRSDSMILCTFQKKTGTLIMTSFLRDLYVEIPGHGWNRLNAAYAFGGASLLEKTLEKNFGVPIDGSIEVDFGRFSQIIDLLGGVELDLRWDEAALIAEETGTNLSSGRQHLNGAQALSYARIRKLDANGDFSRTQRQRNVMSSLLQSFRNLSMTQMLKALSAVLPLIHTDFSGMQILSYAVELFPMMLNVKLVHQNIPMAGTFCNRTINGMAVLVADPEVIRSFLNKSLLTQ